MAKKVLFVIPRLGIGGAQKVFSIIIKHLDGSEFEPVLCLLQGNGVYIAELPPDLKVIDLDCARVAKAFFKLIKTIKQVQPDVVFSALSHLNIMIALCIPFLPRNIAFIARETNIPSINNKQNRQAWLLNALYKRFYPRFSKIICQSFDMQRDLLQSYGFPAEQLTVINNPLEMEKNRLLAQSDKKLFPTGKINLLAVGKLKYQKGFDLLLNALAELNSDKYHLTILGQGELETALKNQAEALHITDRVDFLGEVENPYPYMQQADMFILSSRFEGFPNVVLEALSVGTPVIAFDCKGGISEIITHGKNGILVPEGDTGALAKAIADYAGSFKGEAVQDSVAKYDVAVIKEKYAALLKSCV